MTEKKPRQESDQEQRMAAYSRTWGDGWVVGQIDKTEQVLAILVGLHEKATTNEGKAALRAAIERIEADYKRQFPEGRTTLRKQHAPPEKQR